MFRNIAHTLAVCLFIASCSVEAPDLNNDPGYVRYSHVNGLVQPTNVVDYYRARYPRYHARNAALMAVLDEQHAARMRQLTEGDDKYYDFDYVDFEIRDVLDEKTLKDYSREKIVGYRKIDEGDPVLFNRLYRWYNFQYSDGYSLDIFNDSEMERMTGLNRKTLLKIRYCVEYTIQDNGNRISTEVKYFDGDLNEVCTLNVCG